MKMLVALLSLCLLHSNTVYLVVDKDLKKPLGHTDVFTSTQYLERMFPVYAEDVAVLTDATDVAVKSLNRYVACRSEEQVTAAHTTILIERECDGQERINVTLITRIEGTQASYSFALVRGETDVRKVQRRLLDFATYIDP